MVESLAKLIYFKLKLKMSMKPTVLALLFVCAFAGCSKDDSGNGPTRTQILIGGAWRFHDAGIDVDNNNTIDAPIPDLVLEDCDLDNTFTFRNDGTGFYDEGATRCDPADPQTAEFGWSFTDNDQKITLTQIDFGGLEATFDVRAINEQRLLLSQSVDVGLPVPVTVLLDFRH